jgi:hypothetical protein
MGHGHAARGTVEEPAAAFESEILQTDSECTKSTQSIAATLALQCSACTCPRAGRHRGTYKSTWAKSVKQNAKRAPKRLQLLL